MCVFPSLFAEWYGVIAPKVETIKKVVIINQWSNRTGSPTAPVRQLLADGNNANYYILHNLVQNG